MKNLRNGFTMIELIFVIVILGILAAVAVPKLSATRDDAKVAKMSTNLNTVISDIASSYTSQGTLDLWENATNVNLMTDATTGITSTTDINVTTYLYNNDKQCIKFECTSEGNLTISNGSDTTDRVCSSVQTKQSKNLISHIFGGTSIKE